MAFILNQNSLLLLIFQVFSRLSSHICLRLIGINSFTCLLYLHTTDSNRLQSEEMNTEWVRDRNLKGLLKSTIQLKGRKQQDNNLKKEESLISNQA